MLGSTSTTKLPSTGARAKSEEPERGEQEPGRERAPDAEAHHELRREPERERAHDQVGRQEREPDLQRAVAEHELQVERREEEPGEHRRRPEDADDVRGREVAQPEQAERHRAAPRRATRSRGRRRAAPPPRRAGRASRRTSSRSRCRSRSRRRRASATAVTVTAPATSSRVARAPPARRRQQPQREGDDERSPIGTLTRKIQCQLSTSVRTPPSSTPMLPPPEATKPKMPIAFARSAGSVNRVIISESATAETTAPPSPCTARAATSMPCELARPQASEATREERIPTRNSRRCPKRSPSRPPSSRKPPKVSRYAFTTQASDVSEKPRSSRIDGSATFDDRRVEHDHQVAEAEHVEREPAGAAVQCSSHPSFRARRRFRGLDRRAAAGTHRRGDEFSAGERSYLADGLAPADHGRVRDRGPDRARRPARALRPRLRAAPGEQPRAMSRSAT